MRATEDANRQRPTSGGEMRYWLRKGVKNGRKNPKIFVAETMPEMPDGWFVEVDRETAIAIVGESDIRMQDAEWKRRLEQPWMRW